MFVVFSLVGVGKKQLFCFFNVGLCVGENQMCCLCGGFLQLVYNGQVYAKWAIAGFKPIKPLQF